MKAWSQNKGFRGLTSKCIQEFYGSGIDESNPIRKQLYQSNASTQA